MSEAASSSAADATFKFVVKFGKEKYEFDLSSTSTVLQVKELLFDLANVLPERQKLLGLPKTACDDMELAAIPPKPAGYSLILMGSTQEQLDSVKETDDALRLRSAVEDDLDLPDELSISPEHNEQYLALIEKRIRSHKPKMLNPFAPGKKVLVLDVDYTLFDHRSVAERPEQLMRPFLHEFLTLVYPHYNIVIWSATSMSWIEVKMRELGVLSHGSFKVTCFMDRSAMIPVESPPYGRFVTKPLGVLWGQFPEHANPGNTIMFDDLRRNFIMNPGNGLKIAPCRDLPLSDRSDRELLCLAEYLLAIKDLESFLDLDHRRWSKYVSRKRGRSAESS